MDQTETQILAIYEAYPKKVAKALALKAIRKALAKVSFEELLEAVVAYAAARKNQERCFTPHPASWFNQERWSDDRTTWTDAPRGFGQKPSDPSRRHGDGNGQYRGLI